MKEEKPMQVEFAHLRERSTSGGWIDFAVFNAKSTSGNNGSLLAELTMRARNAGCKIDQSALVFREGSRTRFYGDQNLVKYLSRLPYVPQFNKAISF